VITSYNYENYIKNCIDSCLLQEDHSKDYEILVINDGSTDRTQVILEQYEGIPNITVYNIKNLGIEEASNFGFKKSLGKYIVRVDADDMILPNYIKSIEKAIDSNEDFIYTNYSTINSKGEVLIKNSNLPLFDVNEIMSRGDFLATGTAYKNEILSSMNGYNTMIRNSGLENYELILNLIQKGFLGYYVQEISFLYRRHDQNISKLKKDAIIKNGYKLFNKLGLGNYRTNKFHPYELRINQ